MPAYLTLRTQHATRRVKAEAFRGQQKHEFDFGFHTKALKRNEFPTYYLIRDDSRNLCQRKSRTSIADRMETKILNLQMVFHLRSAAVRCNHNATKRFGEPLCSYVCILGEYWIIGRCTCRLDTTINNLNNLTFTGSTTRHVNRTDTQVNEQANEREGRRV